MDLAAKGRMMAAGETSPVGDTGLQIRKLPGEDGLVIQEIAHLGKWRKFKEAQNRRFFTEAQRKEGATIPDPPVSPELAEKQRRAAENLGKHQFQGKETQ